MSTKRGNELTAADRQHVLAAYVYRNTIENKQANPDAVRAAGGSLPPISDEVWLAITEFNVTKDGTLDQRQRYCHTWHSEVPEWNAILHPKPKTELKFISLISDNALLPRASHFSFKDGDSFLRVGGELPHGYKFRPATAHSRDELVAWLESLRFDTEPPGV
jgi:hypothetical protein